MLTFESHSSRPGGKKLSSEMRMRVMSHIFFSVFTHKMHNFFLFKETNGMYVRTLLFSDTERRIALQSAGGKKSSQLSNYRMIFSEREKTTRIGIFIPSLITPMNSIYLSEKCSYLHQLFINVNIPLKNCVNMEIGHVNNISFVTFPVNFLYMY